MRRASPVPFASLTPKEIRRNPRKSTLGDPLHRRLRNLNVEDNTAIPGGFNDAVEVFSPISFRRKNGRRARKERPSSFQVFGGFRYRSSELCENPTSQSTANCSVSSPTFSPLFLPLLSSHSLASLWPRSLSCFSFKSWEVSTPPGSAAHLLLRP